MTEQEFYTPEQVSVELKGLLKRVAITQRCNDGRIKTIRFGGKHTRFKIPASEIERLKKEVGLIPDENVVKNDV